MINTTAMHSKSNASKLGHRFFQKGVLPPSLEPPIKERNSEVVAVACSSSSLSSPWALRSSLDKRGVTSLAVFEGCERVDREDRADFWEAGREVGVAVEAHGLSGVSMVGSDGSVAEQDTQLVRYF